MSLNILFKPSGLTVTSVTDLQIREENTLKSQSECFDGLERPM